MTEVEPMEFYERVTDSENSAHKEYTLEHQSNAELTVELHVVDRKKLLNEIHKLPDEMMEMFQEADDEDDAQELAEERNMLSGVNGDTIEAFENICVHSMRCDGLTEHNFIKIVEELSFDALFEIGAEVIELSFENQGSIKDFHEVDSDRNS